MSHIIPKKQYRFRHRFICGRRRNTKLDVRDYQTMDELIGKIEPDMVMHLAAETDVDKCEIEPDHAFLTNTIGTQNVALICQKEILKWFTLVP